ncbi:MAG: TetR/AcrR family transcriptional regulator [Rhizobiaceae bacterium]|nr:TetR/AcrR family transcriptional regulator [Rhizobiaceae bacterium]
MAKKRPSSKHKILAAAVELAHDSGPGSLSLEAVAKRAGISKGGLLYHFPSKAKLMQGLVEAYLKDFEAALDAATNPAKGKGEDLMSAYVRLSLIACDETHPPAAWIFSAMAEDPDFLNPLNEFRRRLLDRLKAHTPDLANVLTVFFVIEGLHSMKLFGANLVSDDERKLIDQNLLAMAQGRKPVIR